MRDDDPSLPHLRSIRCWPLQLVVTLARRNLVEKPWVNSGVQTAHTAEPGTVEEPIVERRRNRKPENRLHQRAYVHYFKCVFQVARFACNHQPVVSLLDGPWLGEGNFGQLITLVVNAFDTHAQTFSWRMNNCFTTACDHHSTQRGQAMRNDCATLRTSFRQSL